MYHAVQCLIS